MACSTNAEYFKAYKCCRVCLTPNFQLFDIFSEHPIEKDVTIFQILRDCTSYSIERNDDLPKQICCACINDACSAYRFRRRADEQYRYLSGISEQAQKPKTMLVENATQTDESVIDNYTNHCKCCNRNELRENNAKRPFQRRSKHINLDTNCKLCEKQCGSLLELREHLITNHHYEECFNGSICRICKSTYSRRDHVKRHLRNIHKITKCLTTNRIIVEQPQTETMGRVQYNTELCKGTLLKTDANDLSTKSYKDNNDDNDMYKKMMKTTPAATAITTPTAAIVGVEKETYQWHKNDWQSLIELIPSGANADNENKLMPKNVNVPLRCCNEDAVIDIFDLDMKSSMKIESPQTTIPISCQQCPTPEISSHNSNYSNNNSYDNSNSNNEMANLVIGTSSINNVSGNAVSMDTSIARHKTDMNTLNNLFKCTVCQRKFLRKYHMQRHMLVHTKEKPYECRHCDKKFGRNDQLSRHRKESCKNLKTLQ